MNIKTKKTEDTKEVKSVVKSVKVTRAKVFENEKGNSVLFDVEINDVAIYGCRVVEGKNGDFISFPSRQGKDNKYYSHAYVKLTADDTKEIISQVEKALAE